MLDVGHGAGDLAGDEGLAAARRLVVEQNAAGSVEPVALPVIHRDVVAEDLGAGVRAARVEDRGLALRRRRAAEHLARGGLVEAALARRTPHGFQQAQRADGDHIGGVLGDLEAHLHVALRAEVVDLIRAQIVEERGERAAVGEVGVVEEEAGCRPRGCPGRCGRDGRC